MAHNSKMHDFIASNCVDGQTVPGGDQAAAQLLFDVADATWRCEAAKVLRQDGNKRDLDDLPEAQGEPGTLLRTSYEVRERAYAELRRLLAAENQ
ncbi:hypothetical protein [Methylorubrum suomiense]|uniref:Uncharacterized protein n=1 Tax=Methylorubrum suomiense TaxID=144191 RepID=A0ABQ4URA4_9HYPH|nr:MULTISPECIES: hypothetical protein [Methylobacteriaceae]GJE73899.1 hypothetical protein BGCPKDLD_0466 [Methylorubrum suomiense]